MDQFDGNRIRGLRLNLNMTREDFAYQIGVTFSTVEGWENDHTKPNRIARKILGQIEQKFLRNKQRGFSMNYLNDQFSKERIRDLRRNLNLTQENFAHEIGVTFATVNRWENGHTQPNRVAQKILRNLEHKFQRQQRTQKTR